MDNKDLLEKLLRDLRDQLTAVNASPILPGSVKTAVNTTFQIMEILIAENANG
jgi:hypothetical protein